MSKRLRSSERRAFEIEYYIINVCWGHRHITGFRQAFFKRPGWIRFLQSNLRISDEGVVGFSQASTLGASVQCLMKWVKQCADICCNQTLCFVFPYSIIMFWRGRRWGKGIIEWNERSTFWIVRGIEPEVNKTFWYLQIGKRAHPFALPLIKKTLVGTLTHSKRGFGHKDSDHNRWWS